MKKDLYVLPEDLERARSLAAGQVGFVRVISAESGKALPNLEKLSINAPEKTISGESLIKAAPQDHADWKEYY